MCGIFGFVGKRERAQSIDLHVALKSLHHRGPDDRGTFFGVSKADPDIACAFAHTRLSIIDLSPAGHQPMTTETGRYTIVYNGEIYNFRDLRAELQQLGCRFESNCDTEVVLKAYVRWGRESVQRLRGMFAFAIWDRDLGTLFLVRDRLGIKPLYYTQTADGFAFSSEVRALMNCGIAERRISRDGLNSYLAFGSAAEPFTIIENVLALPTGSYAETDGNDVRIASYWSLADAAERADANADPNSVIRSAIVSELEADVPVGIFLSGGIDSSTIVAIASTAATQPVHTFTVTFDETEYSEEKYAAEVASRYGCDHHQVHLSANAALADLDNMFAALDQPSADGVNTYFVSKAARESGLSVVLSGLGGDEVFAGYANFRSFGAMLSIARVVSPVAKLMPALVTSPFRYTSRRTRKVASLLRSGGNAAKAYAVIREMFSDNQINSLQPAKHRDGFVAATTVDSCIKDGDAVNLYSRLELANYLRNTLLRDADAMSMAHSLEVRVPLLDHTLLETVLRTPGSKKISRRSNKPLLVNAAGTLPANIYQRPKMGFTVPMEQWLRGPFEERVKDLLTDRARNREGILDADGIENVWAAFKSGERYMNYSRVWCLAAFLAWSRSNRVAS